MSENETAPPPAPAPLTTFDIEVTQRVRVTLDATKFTREFFEEFRASFFPLFTLEDHACHLAQIAARGVAELSPNVRTEFVEGYGPIGEMGISAEITDGDEEVIGRVSATPSTPAEASR